MTAQPVLTRKTGQDGPGGACVVKGPAGDQWLAYHAWTAGAIGVADGHQWIQARMAGAEPVTTCSS
jgi:hypothetical protein